MKQREGSLLQTLYRIDAFITSHAELASLVGSPARGTLTSTTAAFTTHTVAQDQAARSSKGETSRQAALREILRTKMQGVAGIARLKLKDIPDFSALRMPASTASSIRMVAAAGAMGEVANRHAQVFLDGGLPTDFVAQLAAAADDVKTSIVGRDAHKGTRRNATTSLAQLSKDATSVITVLDSLVRPLIGSNAGLLAEWRATKRVTAKPGPVKTTVAAAPTPAQGVTPPTA